MVEGRKTYRLIAIDLDGTLLNPAGDVSPRVAEAVARAAEAGAVICLATGRSFSESRMALEAVPHDPLAVFSGGAIVIDTVQRSVFHRVNMQPALAAATCEFIESFGQAALALQDSMAAGVDYVISDAPLDPTTARWMARWDNRTSRVPDLRTHHHQHTIRVGTAGPSEKIRQMHAKLIEQFGPGVTCHALNVPMTATDVLEVFDPTVDKWQGVRRIAQRYGIVSEQTIAIGDDMNDLAMIQSAALGVAMGNAKPAIKAAARRTIESNGDDGLCRFLNELIDHHQISRD